MMTTYRPRRFSMRHASSIPVNTVDGTVTYLRLEDTFWFLSRYPSNHNYRTGAVPVNNVHPMDRAPVCVTDNANDRSTDILLVSHTPPSHPPTSTACRQPTSHSQYYYGTITAGEFTATIYTGRRRDNIKDTIVPTLCERY
jgi:hypothetical protein